MTPYVGFFILLFVFRSKNMVETYKASVFLYMYFLTILWKKILVITKVFVEQTLASPGSAFFKISIKIRGYRSNRTITGSAWIRRIQWFNGLYESQHLIILKNVPHISILTIPCLFTLVTWHVLGGLFDVFDLNRQNYDMGKKGLNLATNSMWYCF